MRKSIIKNKRKSLLTIILVACLSVITAVGISFSVKNTSKVNAYKDPGSAEVARVVAEEGIVVLRNESNALPFNKTMKIGGLGTGQDTQFIVGGGGSGWVDNGGQSVTPKDGLLNAASKGYISSYTAMGSPTGTFDRVIYFISRNSTEGDDMKISDYYLTDVEKNDINNLITNFGSNKVIIVLNIPTIIDTTWLIQKNVGAIVCMWLPGEQGGNALANVLTGVVTPSGKLADTWAKSYEDYISSYGTNKAVSQFASSVSVNYYEDLYLGYRYYETFDKNYEKVNYEFGFGLSYTTFDIKTTGVNVNKNTGKIKVYVTVKNTGSVYSGKEVVQVYYSTPDDKIDAPAKQLIGYAKTKLLAPNESQNLTIDIDINEMSQFDDTGRIQKNAYVLQAGDYDLFVGNSVKNAGKNKVATYTVNSDLVIEQCGEIDSHVFKRLNSDGTYEYLDIDYYSVKEFGKKVFQAEDLESITNERDIHADTYHKGVSEGVLLRLLSNQTFRYRIWVEKAGTYNISFNMSNGSTTDYTDMFEIYVDYTPDDNVDNGVAQNINASLTAIVDEWKNWRVVYGNTVTFNRSGEILLTFKCNSQCGDMDFFTIYNDNVAPSGETIISADTFTNSDGIIREGTINGNLASGFRNTGNFAEYKVNVEKAGGYYLSLDAVTPFKATENLADIYLNNERAGSLKALRSSACPEQYKSASESEPGAYTNPTIDCWFTSCETSSILLNLKQGENTIKILATSTDSLCNVKSLIFRTTQKSFTYKDNTSDYTFKSVEEAKSPIGSTGWAGYKFLDVIEGKCTVEQFVRQFEIRELTALSMLEEPRGDVNSGTGGIGGVPGWNLTSKTMYELPYASTSDGPAGQRFCNSSIMPDGSIYKYATWFPCVTLLTATWNVDLAYTYGNQYAKEDQVTHTSIMLCPGVNIHRNPLCGRNFEYMSEDPFLTGMMASYYIRGAQARGVACSIKHFYANNQELNRHNSNNNISPRALREIYFKPFEMAIKNANPGTLMTSYGFVNGVATSANAEVLRNIVRGEWGYDGFIESDWGENTLNVNMIKGGNNAHSYFNDYYNTIGAWQQGTLTYDELVENVSWLIKFLMRSNASALSNYIYTDTDKSIKATSRLTRTDGSGTVWEVNHTKDINDVSATSSIVNKVSGINGNAKLQNEDQTTYVGFIDSSSVAYYAICVDNAGDYYLAYTLNVGAVEGKYGAFEVYIDGIKADTFTNPSRKTSANVGDWNMEDVFVGDNGSARVNLNYGIHRIAVVFKDQGFNLHNILFSYGQPQAEGISVRDGQIEVRNYASKTGSVRIEGDHLASTLEGSSVEYNVNFETTGLYAISYILNVPGRDGCYGNFETYLDGNKVDTFTNPNKITTSQNADVLWTDTKTYYGDNGQVKLNVVSGMHRVKFVFHQENVNFKTINFEYVQAESLNNVSKTDIQTAEKIKGASILVSPTKEGGIRFAMTVSQEEIGQGEILAVRVKSTVDASKVTVDNYAEFGGKSTTVKTENIDGKSAYIAEFKPETDYSTQYKVIFFIVSVKDDLTITKKLVTDARSCKEVAQSLIAKGLYNSEQIGYYLA